jgi:hypothetical protein
MIDYDEVEDALIGDLICPQYCRRTTLNAEHGERCGANLLGAS